MKVKILAACYGDVIVGAIVPATDDALDVGVHVSGRVLHKIDPAFVDDDFPYFFVNEDIEVQDE